MFLPSFPLWFAIWLHLIRHDGGKLGLEILATGATASLDNVGFKRVAALGSTRQMMRFVERVIQEVLHASIKDDVEFYTFAALAFRDRLPVFGSQTGNHFGELENALRQCKWIQFREISFADATLPHKEAVLIDCFFDDLLKQPVDTLKGNMPLKLGRGARTWIWLHRHKLAAVCDKMLDLIEAVKMPICDLILWGRQVSSTIPGAASGQGVSDESTPCKHAYGQSVHDFPNDFSHGRTPDKMALDTYKMCAYTGIGCFIAVEVLTAVPFKVLSMVVCTLFLTSSTTLAKRLITYIRATHNQSVLREHRSRKWAFLVGDEDHGEKWA